MARPAAHVQGALHGQRRPENAFHQRQHPAMALGAVARIACRRFLRIEVIDNADIRPRLRAGYRGDAERYQLANGPGRLGIHPDIHSRHPASRNRLRSRSGNISRDHGPPLGRDSPAKFTTTFRIRNVSVTR